MPNLNTGRDATRKVYEGIVQEPIGLQEPIAVQQPARSPSIPNYTKGSPSSAYYKMVSRRSIGRYDSDKAIKLRDKALADKLSIGKEAETIRPLLMADKIAREELAADKLALDTQIADGIINPKGPLQTKIDNLTSENTQLQNTANINDARMTRMLYQAPQYEKAFNPIPFGGAKGATPQAGQHAQAGSSAKGQAMQGMAPSQNSSSMKGA